MKVDNLIFIKGGSYNDVKKALRQWIDLYSENFDKDLVFELYKSGRGKHIIKADKKLDNEQFFYLVNYLHYPEGIKYKIEIEGFTIGKDQKEFFNQPILVFVPENDTEGDNVFVVTSENQTLKVDFGGKITGGSEMKEYKIPEFSHLDIPEIIRVSRKGYPQRKREEQKSSIAKRFEVILLIALGLFFISFLTFFIDRQTFVKSTFFLGLGIGIWFFSDYEMLREDTFYFKCLIIATVYLGYGLLVTYSFSKDDIKITDLGALYPIVVSLVQRPLRLILLLLFKKEPKVERSGTFADLLYTLILFLGIAVLPLILMDYIK